MDILNYQTISELAAIGEAWDRLSECEPRFVTSFSELRHRLETSKARFRVLAAVDDGQVVGLACFIYADAVKRYFIAEFGLFDLRVKMATLFDSCILGQLDERLIEKFLKLVLDDKSFDVLDVGFIIVGSALYNAVIRLRGGVIVGRASRTVHVEWLIKLPATFDAYLKSLGKGTRVNDVRRFRQLARRHAFAVDVVHRLDQIDKFLQDAEKISRLTYQWALNAGFRNDAATRERLTRFAKNGTLRCYIGYLDGEPCAFAYGEMRRRIYMSRQIGFDPKFAKKSPGTAVMLQQIRDLIENTDCELIDFGAGGHFDYKTRFGNTSLDCVHLQIGFLYRPYSFCTVVLDRIVNATKNLLSLMIGRGKLMQRLDQERARRLRRLAKG